MMNITFTARKFDASQNLQDFAAEEVNKLTRFYDGILSCDIVLIPTPDDDEPARAELTVKVKRDLLNASETGPAYEQAIRSAVDSLRKQLLKYKNKRFSKG
ncbi:ribosome-associated translation inhibitor RaiA [Balneolales bacterium ANBcel1]|nr:ribosome-associated translation inhibitor RaiA [Balneolales bacterium ANBcel1]